MRKMAKENTTSKKLAEIGENLVAQIEQEKIRLLTFP